MYARAGAPLLLAVSQPLLCILTTAAAAAQRPTAEVYSENSACVIARRDRSLYSAAVGGRRLPPQPADRGPTPVPPTEYRESISATVERQHVSFHDSAQSGIFRFCILIRLQ